jgi:hypothetical protein
MAMELRKEGKKRRQQIKRKKKKKNKSQTSKDEPRLRDKPWKAPQSWYPTKYMLRTQNTDPVFEPLSNNSERTPTVPLSLL